MKCFGYKKNSDQISSMREITIQASPSELRKLADFMIKCAGEIEEGQGWEHEHFNDYSGSEESGFDLVIFASK